MTTEKVNDLPEKLTAKPMFLKGTDCQVRTAICIDGRWQMEGSDDALVRAIVTRYNSAPALLAACEDCQDFLSAIVEATSEGGRIDEASIMRYGERLKTTAKKLDVKLRAAIKAAKEI